MKAYPQLLYPFLILAVSALTSIMECEARGLTMRYCSFFYYATKSGCTICKDRCPPGQGFVKNCGYDAYGRKVKPACTPCKDGYFTPKKNYYIENGPSLPCRPCRKCYPPSRTKRNCSATRNAKCFRCPRGMYKNRNGHCYKCSYCCDGMLEKNINVVASCARKSSGRCVCTEDTICYDNVDHNAKCFAYKGTAGVGSVFKMKSWGSLKPKAV